MKSASLGVGARLTVVLVLGLSLTACGDDGDGEASEPETVATVTVPPSDASTGAMDDPTPSMPTSAPTTAPSMTVSPTGEVDAEELAEDLDGAVQITDLFWQDHWNDFFTGTYIPPTVEGLYDGNDPSSAPQCFGEPLPPGNAFYCPDGDYVAWDQTLLELGYEIGDAWPYLIVAHEWGHAVQARLSRKLQAEQLELQADCLAGATLYGSADDGNLDFEEGDEKEIVDALNRLGDETPWTMSGDHGDSFQRIEAFNAGRSGGVEACLPRG